jgi:hypothetical protein
MSYSAVKDYLIGAAQKWGVPHDLLIAIAEQESNFRPWATGAMTKYGQARGMMQILPSTGAAMGVTNYRDLYKPDVASDTAAKYLSQLKAKYGTWVAAVSHYFGEGYDPVSKKSTGTYTAEVFAKAKQYSDVTGSGTTIESGLEGMGIDPASVTDMDVSLNAAGRNFGEAVRNGLGNMGMWLVIFMLVWFGLSNLLKKGA